MSNEVQTPTLAAQQTTGARRWARRTGLAVSAVLLVFAALIAAVVTIDHQYLRNDAEGLLTDLLGRKVSIGGPMHLTIRSSVDLSVSNLRIESTDWSQQADLLSLDNMVVSLNTRSLLSDEIVVKSLVIDGLRINLEQADDDKDNWTFALAQKDEGEETDPERPHIPVRFDDLRVLNASVEYRSPDLVDAVILRVDSLAHLVAADQHGELAVSGSVSNTPFDLKTSISDINNFNAMEDVAFGLEGHLGEIDLHAELAFADLLVPSRPTASIELAGPNVLYLASILKIPDVDPGPLTLDVNIAPQNELMRLDASARIGSLEIEAEGTFDDFQVLDNADGQISVKGADAGRLAGIFDVEGLPSEPYTLTAQAQKRGGIVDLPAAELTLGDTRVSAVAHFGEFPSIRGATANFVVDGQQIEDFGELSGLGDALRGPFSANLRLDALADGTTDIVLKADAASLSLAANGNASGGAGLENSVFDVQFETGNFAHIGVVAGIDGLPALAMTLRANVKRRAASLEIENAAMRLGDNTLSVSGTVGDDPLVSGTALKFNLAVTDLDRTLQDFGMDAMLVPASPLTVDSEIIAKNNSLQVKKLSAQFVNTSAILSGTISNLADIPTARIDYNLSGAALSNLLPGGERYGILNNKFRLNGKLDLGETTIGLLQNDFQLGNLTATADLGMSRDSPLERISASIGARSDNVAELVGGVADANGSSDVPLRLQFQGVLTDRHLEIETLNLTSGQSMLTAVGRVNEPPKYLGSDLQLSLDVPDISRFAALAGRTLPGDPLTLSFHLVSIANGLKIDHLIARLGDSDLRGRFQLQDGAVPEISVDLQSTRLNIGRYRSEPTAGTAETQAVDADTDGRLIPSTPVPYQQLAKANVDFGARVGELIDAERSLKDIAVGGHIRNGVLQIDDFRLSGQHGGEVSGQLQLAPSPDGAHLWTRLRGSNVNIGLRADTEEERKQLPRYEFKLALDSSGETVRDLAGAANGYVQIVSGPGRVKAGALKMLTQDFVSELLTTINPFLKNDPYTNLQCTVVLATFEDGQLLGRPALVRQSDRLKVTAALKINLKTEALDADINTVAQKGLGISLNDLLNPYVRVGGTLAKPVLAVDKQSALVEGGVAVATGGISILAKSFAERVLGAKDPCAVAIADAAPTLELLDGKYGDMPTRP